MDVRLTVSWRLCSEAVQSHTASSFSTATRDDLSPLLLSRSHTTRSAAPANGAQLKMWTCYDDLPAQAFYLTDDQHIANTNTGLCLDIKDQQFVDSTPLQLWDCSNTAANQLFEAVTVASLPAAHNDYYH